MFRWWSHEPGDDAPACVGASALYDVALSFAKGTLPDVARRVEPICRMIGLRKRDGGTRPIGVGSAFRRLVGGALVRQHAGKLMHALFPSGQQAVAVPNGPEVFACTLEAFIEDPDCATSHVVVGDLKGMFQFANRETALKQCRDHVPELFAFSSFLVAAPVEHVVFGSDGVARRVYSESLAQGCSVSPALSCFALRPALVELLKWRPPDSRAGSAARHLQISYADNVVFGADSLEDACSLLQRFRTLLVSCDTGYVLKEGADHHGQPCLGVLLPRGAPLPGEGQLPDGLRPFLARDGA